VTEKHVRISLYRHPTSEPQPKLTTERLAKQFRKPNLRVRKYLILWHLRQYIARSTWLNTLHCDPMPLLAQKPHAWTADKIRLLVERKLGKRPCWFQIRIALMIYQKKDVIATAATGSGKTLSFWIPILMALEDGKDVTEFIITPLNILGKQQI
jgi:ATP-dependent helicase YprA (DUF1998 family)